MKSAFQEFNRIDGQIERAYHEAALKMGLSDSEMWLLYTLETRGPGCTQALLCRETGMSKTTVNSALKKMEREGRVRMEPGEGRSTRVFLTREGCALTQRTVCRLIGIENGIYESWPPEEQALLTRLNQDFADKLTEQVEKM